MNNSKVYSQDSSLVNNIEFEWGNNIFGNTISLGYKYNFNSHFGVGISVGKGYLSYDIGDKESFLIFNNFPGKDNKFSVDMKQIINLKLSYRIKNQKEMSFLNLYELGLSSIHFLFQAEYKKENVLKIINSGALGWLTKECEKNEILAALESMARGERFICNKILDVILEKKHGETNAENDLTDREVEIIKLIAERYSNQEIAEKLFISIHTVYTHRKNIMKKLQLKSPVELILYAIDKGIIPPYQN